MLPLPRPLLQPPLSCATVMRNVVSHIFQKRLCTIGISGFRNAGVGMASVFAGVGGMIAPLIVILEDFRSYLPLTVFGILALITGLLGFLLPETSGRPLAQDTNEHWHERLEMV